MPNSSQHDASRHTTCLYYARRLLSRRALAYATACIVQAPLACCNTVCLLVGFVLQVDALVEQVVPAVGLGDSKDSNPQVKACFLS
jgi:hypothetical protein